MDDLLNQTCTIYSDPTDPDAFGKKVWGFCENVACRFVKVFKHYKDNTGNFIEITAKFQVAEISVNVGSKVVYNSRPYKVLDCKEWIDGDGELFGSVIYCANWPV